MRRLLNRLRRDEQGATTLEWTLLLAVIVLPAYAVIQAALTVLVTHYRMLVTLNGLPLP